MEVLGLRTYKVTLSEFPLAITITPKGTAGHAATGVILGHVRVVVQGTQVSTAPVSDSTASGVVSYSIPAPNSGGVHVTQSVQGWFATREPDSARFEIAITTAKGKSEKTVIRRPTLNPGVANLTFKVS